MVTFYGKGRSVELLDYEGYDMAPELIETSNFPKVVLIITTTIIVYKIWIELTL